MQNYTLEYNLPTEYAKKCINNENTYQDTEETLYTEISSLKELHKVIKDIIHIQKKAMKIEKYKYFNFEINIFKTFLNEHTSVSLRNYTNYKSSKKRIDNIIQIFEALETVNTIPYIPN